MSDCECRSFPSARPLSLTCLAPQRRATEEPGQASQEKERFGHELREAQGGAARAQEEANLEVTRLTRELGEQRVRFETIQRQTNQGMARPNQQLEIEPQGRSPGQQLDMRGQHPERDRLAQEKRRQELGAQQKVCPACGGEQPVTLVCPVEQILLKIGEEPTKEHNQTNTETVESKQKSRARLVLGKLHVDAHRLELELESVRLQGKIDEMDAEVERMKCELAERRAEQAKRQAEAELKVAETEKRTAEIRASIAKLREGT